MAVSIRVERPTELVCRAGLSLPRITAAQQCYQLNAALTRNPQINILSFKNIKLINVKSLLWKGKCQKNYQ